ncbi:MAG TPA: glycoside hydrolase family 97 N-terminal domain-containing protein, partial [Opitutaceae bacterium]|nr:glycoside hydrolase family 97 N-terminal domain-containing protein [Opitutaceae bacterium]
MNRVFLRPFPAAAGVLLAAANLLPIRAAHADSGPTVLTSPDGQLTISFQIQPDPRSAPAGQLIYSVNFRGKPVITPSALGLELQS